MILRQLIELLEEDVSFTLYYADTLEPIEEITDDVLDGEVYHIGLSDCLEIYVKEEI